MRSRVRARERDVCESECMCVYVCESECMCVYVCESECMCVYTCVRARVHVRLYVCESESAFASIRV